MPEATLILDGFKHTGWTEIEVTRSIESLAASFRLGLTERWAGTPAPRALKPGLACVVALVGVPVLAGHIDTVEVSYDDREHRLAVTGRDRLADLVDCAAAVDGPHEFQDLDLADIARRLCVPYGVSVAVETDIGPPFKRFALQPGETAFEALERACRIRAVLPTTNGLGALILTRAGRDRAPAALVLGENILSGAGGFSHAGRFSRYIVKGEQEPDPFSEGQGTDGTQARVGSAFDTDITRHRPTVIIGEAQGDAAALTDRARWQRQVARGRGARMSYTVAGWTANGMPWRPNALVAVTDPLMDLSAAALLITSVTFTKSERTGTRTTLELTRQEAFALRAEPEPEGNGLSGLAFDPETRVIDHRSGRPVVIQEGGRQ